MGFRATTREIVRRSGLELAGWVRNEADGSVSLVLEGSEKDVERALGEIRSTMRGFIGREEIEPADEGERLEGFEVRR